MAILPLQLARVSSLMQSSLISQSVSSTQQQLLTVENELSTGKSVNEPSDNPAAAATILQLQRSVDRITSYNSNITQANSNLGETDSSLSDLSDLLQQAINTASANVSSTETAAQRQAAATVVQSLYTQALSIANKQFNGAYLFGGTQTRTPPYQSTAAGVTFVGSTDLLQNAVDDSSTQPLQVSGSDVFGGLADRVEGATDLSPAITSQTRIADLSSVPLGTRLGSIVVSNGTVTKTIDLSSADTLGDVVTLINSAGVGGIIASIPAGSTGLQLSGAAGDNITVNDYGGGSTAVDLGILQTTGLGAGITVNGASVGARVTDLTNLSDLRGGAGISTAGLTISNGATSQVVSFASDTTVQQMLNSINAANLGVTAEINSTGTGIDLLGNTQGESITISEAGGTTAADLGVRTFTTSTPLSELNNGAGVSLVSGNDLQITRCDGSSFQVDLNGCNTIQDVINAINTADGGHGVTASFGAQTNGIILTDSTGGSGTLAAESINGSSAAHDLGLDVAPIENTTINGADVNPVVTPGVFTDLSNLISGLQNNNQALVTSAASGLTNDQSQVNSVRGQIGAEMQGLQTRQTQISDQTTATQSLISSLQDTDYAQTVTRFQTLQTLLQASLQTAASTLNLNLLNFLQ